MNSSSPRAGAIAVLGATGAIGSRVARELDRAGAHVVVVGRRAGAVAELARALAVDGRVADASDPAALSRAFAGARVVVNAAGPLRDTAIQVLDAALAAGAHYVDAGGEQRALVGGYECRESAVRHAGLVALPGAGLDGAIGDLAAAWAAAHVIGASDPGDAVRAAPAERLAEDRPLDDVSVAYVFDDLVLSAGSQRAVLGAIGARPLVWQRDRWEPGRLGDHRRVNAGPALGGERDALAYPGSDPITIPRHVAALRVASYLSATRGAGASTALRLLSSVLSLVPRRAGGLLAPYAETGADLGRTRLAVVVQARRGFSAAQIVVRGHDLYRTSAAITAWLAHRIAERTSGPIGMRAPGELYRAEHALRSIASAADLTIEPSFG